MRQWCEKFGPQYARNLRRRQARLGDVWHLDEVFVNIQGLRHYLWRAEGTAKHTVAAGDGQVEKLRRCSPQFHAFRDTRQYANNRAEVSHQPTRQRERLMRRFKSTAA